MSQKPPRAQTYPGVKTAKTPHKGLTLVDPAAPNEVEREDSSVIEDPDARRESRRKRTTDQRVEHVEDRVDNVAALINEMRLDAEREKATTAKAIGELTGSVNGLAKVVEIALRRDQQAFDVGLEVKRADKLDGIAGRATWRHSIAKWLGTGALGAGALKIAAVVAHWMGIQL